MRYLLILMLFCACNPLKHYQRVANDDFRNAAERSLLAKAANEEFPVKIDSPTVTVTVDSSALYEVYKSYDLLLQDYLDHLQADSTKDHTDTIFLEKIKRLKPAVITRTITKEIPVRSTAVEATLQNRIDACRSENDGLIVQARNAKEEKKKARSTMAFLWIISGLLLAGHVVPLIRKIA